MAPLKEGNKTAAEAELAVFKESVENSSDAIGMSTPDGRHYYQNLAFDKLFGKIGVNPPASLYVDRNVGEEVFAAIRSGREWTGEVKMFSREGQILTILLRAYASKDEQGRVKALVGVHTDITKRKQAEEELRMTISNLNRSQAIAQTGNWDWDLAADRFSASPEGLRIMGFAPDDHPAFAEVSALIHPDDRKRVGIVLKDSLASGRPYSVEFRILKKDSGEERIVLSQAEIEKNPGGKAIKVFGVNRDVTAAKLTEKALRESEARFRQIAEFFPETIFECETDTRIIWVNFAGFQKFGYDSDDLERGLFGLNLIAAQDRDRARENISLLFMGKKTGPSEYLALKKDGSSFNVLMYSAVKFANGRPIGLHGMIIDITERIQAEQEREKLQLQLLQAQKMESVGILAGGVAHDFNNLLQAMSGNIELLMTGKPPDHLDLARLKTVSRTIERAGQLIRQLLLFSRKAETRKQAVNINLEAAEVVKILERTIPRMIEIELELEDQVWLLQADPVQVEQVLLNLAGNAADAMPEGGHLTISTKNFSPDKEFARQHLENNCGPYVMMMVKDTGCGMNRETLNHIFEPFFSTKEVGRGTGLGLASVYGIVKSHGGYITCDSNPGRGTCFNVYWPVLQQSDRAAVVPEKSASTRMTGTESILIVEDESEIVEVLRSALESSGYNVFSAASGEEALRIFSMEPDAIDLVLLDLGLPGMGGRQCLAELLRLNPVVPVLITSGYTTVGKAGETLAAGAVGFIGKPYQLDQLLQKIRLILDAACKKNR